MAISTPLPTPGPTAVGSDHRVAAVLAGFRAQRIEPTELSLLYRLAMGAVATAMVLLPLVYIALIIFAGWGVYWYATHAADLLSGVRGRAFVFAFVAPLFTGVVLLFFMVKPLFARPSKAPEPLLIDRDAEPAVWALVENICRAVRAPIPRTIAVDCEVNASASFARGWRGFLTGNLRLTIGLPLAAGLQLEELTGVLAHEFGHFAQGGGMRLSFVVRSVSGWFARVVYERDSWDQHLAGLGKVGGWGALLAAIAMGMVWLGRRILWCLMWVGFAISSYLLRQMEYDADSYAARVVGSDTTNRMSQRIVQLSVGSRRAWELVNEGYRAGRVPGDLPGLIANCTNLMPAGVSKQIGKMHEQEKSGLFDTHPTFRNRAAATTRLAQPGIFASTLPATEIFNQFPSLAREATQHRYVVVAGADLSKVQIADNATIVAGEDARLRTLSRVEETFRGFVHAGLPLPLGLEPMTDSTAAARLPEMLAAVRKTVESATPALTKWRDLQAKVQTQQAVAVLLSAHCDRMVRRIEGANPSGGASGAYAQLDTLREEASAAARELAPALAEVAAFLTTAVAARLAASAEDAGRDTVLAEWRDLVVINAQAEHFRRLSEYRNGIGALFAAMQEKKDPQDILRIADSTAGLARRHVDAVFAGLRDVPCQLPDAPQGIRTLRDYFTPADEDGQHAAVTTFRRADRFVDAAAEAVQRLAGNLLNAAVPPEPDIPA